MKHKYDTFGHKNEYQINFQDQEENENDLKEEEELHKLSEESKNSDYQVDDEQYHGVTNETNEIVNDQSFIPILQEDEQNYWQKEDQME